MDLVGIPEPEVRAKQRPYELSGGLRQRALIASAIAMDPKLIIADEPTTALDMTVQAQVLEQLQAAKARGKALILISHDLAVVSQLADTVAVMNGGVLLEYAPAAQLFARPEHEYTQSPDRGDPERRLARRAALPGRAPGLARHRPRLRGDRCPGAEGGASVQVLPRPGRRRPHRRQRRLLRAAPGETLGIVGESGSGKTTTARLALALLEVDGGGVTLAGEEWSGLPERERRKRRADISVIYQDPLSSFDPRWTVEQIMLDALGRAATTGRPTQGPDRRAAGDGRARAGAHACAARCSSPAASASASRSPGRSPRSRG